MKRKREEQPRQPSAPVRLITAVVGPLTRRNAMTWLGLIALVLVVRWLWFEPFFIPSSSMEPTIHGDPRFLRGDRVAVNKLAYGPRIPFTNTRIFTFGRPQRWDIVVFNNVDPDSPHKRLIKRVVGLPGERVQIADGRVYADGEPLELPPTMSEITYSRSLAPSDEQVREFLQHRGPAPEAIVRQQMQAYIDEASPLLYGVRPEPEYSIIPEGHYLLLGDNSPHSVDGRSFGWAPEGHILGRAFCIWWPVGRWHDLTGWTQTWWGPTLLYGIPLLIVLYEILTAFAVFSWRVREGFSGVLRKGERVVINRLSFGVRLPLIGVPLVAARQPRVGEYVLVDPDTSSSTEPFLARVVAVDAGKKKSGPGNTTVLVAREGAGQTPEKTDADRLVGTVCAVWRPLRAARSIAPGAET